MHKWHVNGQDLKYVYVSILVQCMYNVVFRFD